MQISNTRIIAITALVWLISLAAAFEGGRYSKPAEKIELTQSEKEMIAQAKKILEEKKTEEHNITKNKKVEYFENGGIKSVEESISDTLLLSSYKRLQEENAVLLKERDTKISVEKNEQLNHLFSTVFSVKLFEDYKPKFEFEGFKAVQYQYRFAGTIFGGVGYRPEQGGNVDLILTIGAK